MTTEQLQKDIEALKANGTDQSIIDAVIENAKKEGVTLDGNTAETAGKTNPAQQTGATAQDNNVNALTSQSSGASSSTNEVVGDGIADSEPSDLQVELEGLNTKVTEAETALQTCLGANKAPGACSSEKLKVGLARKAVQTFQTNNPDVQPYVAPVEPDVEDGAAGAAGVEIDTTVPSLDWKNDKGEIDYERFNSYNLIANERARKAEWEAQNPGQTYPYGYDLRQMEKRYVAKYGELPADMKPFKTADDLIVSLGGTATGKGAAIDAQGAEEEEEEEEENTNDYTPFSDPHQQHDAHGLEDAMGKANHCEYLYGKGHNACKKKIEAYLKAQQEFGDKYGPEALAKVLQSDYTGGGLSKRRFKRASHEDAVEAFNVEIADFSANFYKSEEEGGILASNEEFKQMQTDAKAIVDVEIVPWMDTYGKEFGVGSDEFWDAVDKKYNELYQAQMKKLGFEDLVTGLYQDGYNEIRESYYDITTPEWAKDNNFNLGLYGFLSTTLPKQGSGLVRLFNGFEMTKVYGFSQQYTSCLDNTPPCDGSTMVKVPVNWEAGIQVKGGGVEYEYKTMSIQEARDFYDKKMNMLVDIELHEQGVSADLDTLTELIPESYDLSDGVGLDDFWGLLGSSAGYMAMMMVPGGVVATAFLSMGGVYSDNLDLVVQAQCDSDPACTAPTPDMYIKTIQEGKDSKGLAIAAGVLIAALEKVGFGKIGKAIFKPKVIQSLLKTQMIRTLGKQKWIDKLQRIGSAALGEAWTEAAQTLVEQLAGGTALGAPTSRVDLEEILLSAQAGGLVGGGVSTPGVAVTSNSPKGTPPVTDAPLPGTSALKNQSLYGGGSFDYDGDVLQVGTTVTVQGLPLPNGEHRIGENEYILVENGKVTSVFEIGPGGEMVKRSNPSTTAAKARKAAGTPAQRAAASGVDDVVINTQSVVGGESFNYEGDTLDVGTKVLTTKGETLADGEYQISATEYVKVENGVVTSKFVIDGEVVVNTIDKVGTRVGSDLEAAAAAAGVDSPAIGTGTIVGGDDFHFEGESIIEGTKVTDTNGTALADGEYQIGDNEFIVVENGQVKHIFEEDPDGQPIYKKEAGKKGSELGGEAKVGSGTNQLNTTTTVDGNTTFEHDGDLAEGTSVNTVTDGVVSPLPDGEYEIEAGKFIKVENGKVTSIFSEGDGGASLQGGEGAGNQSGLSPKERFENATGEGDIIVNKLTLFNNDVIYYEGDNLIVGTKVVGATGNTLPDGEYEINENSFISVKGGVVTKIYENEEEVEVSTSADPEVVQTGNSTTNTNNTNTTNTTNNTNNTNTVVTPPPPISSIPINTSGQPQVQTAGFGGGGGVKTTTTTNNNPNSQPPTLDAPVVQAPRVPVFNVPEVSTDTAIKINVLNEGGQPNNPTDVTRANVATKRTVGNIITTLKPVQFQKVHEWKLQGLQWELNNAVSPSEKATIRDLQEKELDLGEAYYTISQPQFNHVQGTARQEAGGLLFERAQLSRQSLSGTGLDARPKERIKAIDEQLSNIESRAKRGYNSTFLEKVRGAIGPARSVGAQRAATLPQKLIDKVDSLLNQGASIESIVTRVDDTLGELNLSSKQKDAIRELTISQLGKLDKSQYQRLGDFTKAQDAAKLDYVKGMSIEKITEKSAKEFKKQIAQPQLPNLDESIKQLSNYENQKDALLGRSLAQQGVNNTLNEANSSSINNQNWSESRIKKEAAQAEKKIAAFNKDAKSAERNADSIRTMRDFADVKHAVDSMVQQWVNEHVDGQPQLWDNTMSELLALDAQLTNTELDADTIKVVKKKINAKIQDLKTLYLLGLSQVENTISINGAETNSYPPYFNPNLKDAQGGGFDLSFNNPLGNNDIYNYFPEGRGEEIFSKLTISEWGDFLNKHKILEKSTNEKTRTNKLKDLEKIAQEKFDKYKDAENTSHFDQRAERSAVSKALKQVQLKVEPSIDESIEESIEKAEPKPIVPSPIADAKWNALQQDTKTAYEGEILYMNFVSKDTSSKLYNDLVAEYAALVGKNQAEAFSQAIESVDFNVAEGTANAKKVDLVTQLFQNQMQMSQNADVTINNDQQSLELAATKQQIADVEALVDSLDHDTTQAVEARIRLNDLNELLHNQQEAIKMNGALPVVDGAISSDYSGNATIAYANSVLNGDSRNVPGSVEGKLDLDGLPETLTKAEVKKFIKVFKTTSVDIANILHKQAMNSVGVKLEVTSIDADKALTGDAKANIATITAKNDGLENKKLANRSDQLAAAKVIAAVNTGKIKVDGLTEPLATINVSTAVTEEIPSHVSAKLKKEHDGYKAELDALDVQIAEAQSRLEGLSGEALKDAKLEVKKLINAKSEILPYFDNVKHLMNYKSKIKGIDLSRKYVSPHFSITAKEKQAIKGREEKASREVAKVDNMLRLGLNHLKGNHKAIGLLYYQPADLRNAVSYALARLNDNEGGFPTHQSFAESLSNALPVSHKSELTESEQRHEKAYEAYFLMSILENNELIRLNEPEGEYDPWTLEVLKPQMVADFVLGANLKLDPKNVQSMQLDQKTWTEISKTPIDDWKSAVHSSGLKAEGKRNLKKDPIDPTKDANVFKILNTLKDQSKQADQEYATVLEILTYLKNPYMTFTNKSYKRTQRAGKIIERDAVILKLKQAGTDKYYTNARFGSRFRNYDSNSQLNHQASKLAQGGIGTGNPSEITTDGIAWLMADFAENMGAPGKNMQELVNWGWEHLPDALKWSNNIARYSHRITGDKNGKGEADAVPLAIADILELRRVFSSPDPTAHVSNFVTYIDDSASGYQHAGALTKSSYTTGATNLMPDFERQDPYVDTVSDILKRDGIPKAKATNEQLKTYRKIDKKLKEFDRMIEAARDSQETYQLDGEEVSKVKFLYHQRRIWRESVAEELDTYYGVYWGQEYYLGKTRKGGKEGLMKGLYGAGLMGMSDNLAAELGSDKLKPAEIRSDHTMWLLQRVKAEIKAKHPSVMALEKLIKTTVRERTNAAVEAYSVWEKTQNNDDWNNFIKLRDNADIAIRGIYSDLPAVRRYRDADVARVNYKSDYTNAKFNFAIGDAETINNKKTQNKAVGASFVNLIHTSDKEIPAWLILNMKKIGLDVAFLVHDAYGTRLSDMKKLFNGVRQARYDIYKDVNGESALYRTLKQIFPEHEAKAHEQAIFALDGTWKPEYIFHNQHSTSKAGKVKTSDVVNTLYDKMGVSQADIDKTPATIKDGMGEVQYSDGNVSIVYSPETLKEIEKLATGSNQANTYSLLATTVENIVNKLSSFTTSGKHQVETANVIKMIDGLNQAVVNKDLEAFDNLYNQLLDVSEQLKRKDKVFRGYVGTLISTFSSYYENLLANTKVESIPTINNEFENLIGDSQEVIKDIETDEAPNNDQTWDRHSRDDSQIC